MMDLLASLAETLKARVRRTARRQMTRALLGGLALLFVGVGIIAAIAAIGVALAARFGVLAACLIIAAAAFAVAILLLVVVAQQAKEARRRHRAELAQWHRTMQAAKAIVPDLMGGKAFVIATALGLLVGLMAAGREPQDKV